MTKQWFEKTEQYTIDDALGERAWPHTLSLVRVGDEGKTQAGWSKEQFMKNYTKGFFKPDRILREFATEGYPFALLMRSLPMICVDIDGKNGGIQASRILSLPETLAETSKGGNGYHLFYRVPEEVWHFNYGYNEFPDANALIPGVDIRSIGVVYHHPQQRWNALDPAPLPNTVRKLLNQKKQQQAIEKERREAPLSGSDLAIAQEQVLESLARKIPSGKRNTTLYAIGCAMLTYQIKNWEDLLMARGTQLGMDQGELRSIVNHVKQYV